MYGLSTPAEGMMVNEFGLPDVFEAAARARINERCASAYLHDVRGTMQALFSAFELLGRSAKLGGGNPLKVERACDLARRAISNHEKSTLGVLQLLTLQQTAAARVDLTELVHEVTHFLRNDASVKHVTVVVTAEADVFVSAERAKLQTLLVGLLTAALDATPAGELTLDVRRKGDDAVVSFGSSAGLVDAPDVQKLWQGDLCGDPGEASVEARTLQSNELTQLFARKFLAAQGGRLEIDPAQSPNGVLRLYYPGQPAHE